MTVFERIGNYFTKNGGINSISTAILTVVPQLAVTLDPATAAVLTSAFTPEIATMLKSGGIGATMAVLIVVYRISLGIKRMGK